MSVAAFFDAARNLKREVTGTGLTQEEVDELNTFIAKWKPVAHGFALQDAAAFFASLKASFGALSQTQVDGYNRLLNAMVNWPIAWVAYGLATARHETADNLAPVEEAYWKDDAWRKRNLRYYPWHGRGDVQLTWEANYKRADDELGLGGRLVADPTLALDPPTSARILVRGMEHGWFSGKRLADYLPATGQANAAQFASARRIVNGTDKAAQIAGVAMKIQAALVAGGWQ